MPEADPTRILITRPEPGATETAARLAAMGLVPIVAPVLEIAPTTAFLPRPGSIGAILVPSGNALMALGDEWHDRRMLTVGDATARRARASGFNQVVSAGGDARALAALVRQTLHPADATLLLVAGQGQSQALAAELRSDGYRVLRRVVYAARPVAAVPSTAVDVLAGGQVHAVLFFSTETARHFVRLVRRAGLAEAVRFSEAVAIGPSAGVALEALPWRRITVAAKPNQDEMLALLR